MAAENRRPDEHPDLHWSANGQCALSGSLLELDRRIDRIFLRWAAEVGASEIQVPVLLSALELEKLDYFRSFPHLATFAIALDPSEENLESFRNGPPVEDGEVHLTRTAQVREVLTPAACYHFYVLLQGASLEGPRFLTTRANCFRRETHYAPLRRQWCFSMREIVCIGLEEQVRLFLDHARGRVDSFLTSIGLPIEWRPATDPFFRPATNPKHLMQRLEPVKTEMIFGNDLAIGSINLHRNFFGETFRITAGGADAYSGCIAFGVERWIYAFLATFGNDPADWPAEAWPGA